MAGIPFHIVDVFAEHKYEGNQLAVFRNAGGFSSNQMQKIAREMNFSETAFILSDGRRDGESIEVNVGGKVVPIARAELA